MEAKKGPCSFATFLVRYAFILTLIGILVLGFSCFQKSSPAEASTPCVTVLGAECLTITVPEVCKGSGVPISSHLVVTAKHLVEDIKEDTLPMYGENLSVFTPLFVVMEHPTYDLALLRSEKELPYIALGSDPIRGDQVWLVGSAGGRNNLIRFAHVSGFELPTGELLIDGMVRFGDSGGAVLSSENQLLGVMVAVCGSNSYPSVGVAEPVSHVKELLAGVDTED